jgi:hypothetical protein
VSLWLVSIEHLSSGTGGRSGTKTDEVKVSRDGGAQTRSVVPIPDRTESYPSSTTFVALSALYIPTDISLAISIHLANTLHILSISTYIKWTRVW